MCTDRTSFSLRIAWQDGQSSSADADALVFDVLMRQVERRRLPVANVDAELELGPSGSSSHDPWVVVAQNLRAYDALVAKLAPLSSYVFRIRGHRLASDSITDTDAQSVLSPVSSAFETLRRL